MAENIKLHKPVLMDEVLPNLVKKNGIYVDATFGRGGHSEAILKHLSNASKLIAIDKDKDAIGYGKEAFSSETRISFYHGSFAHLSEIIKQLCLDKKLTGILFDLGVSSPQLDDANRGFSFLRDGPLDMRMDTTKGIAASDWLNRVSEKELAEVLWNFGEERYARRIARAFIRKRAEKFIDTTQKLAEIVAAAHPAWQRGKHPATKSFQAIRIFINNELDDLQQGLQQSLEMLEVGGRMAVISFHSLEDRIVKRFIQEQEKGGNFPAGLPVTRDMCKPRLKRVGRAIKPSQKEVAMNPRARSAVLRIAEKIL